MRGDLEDKSWFILCFSFFFFPSYFKRAKHGVCISEKESIQDHHFLKYTEINLSPAPCFYSSLFQAVMGHGQAMFLLLEATHRSCQVTELQTRPYRWFGVCFWNTLDRHVQSSTSQIPALAFGLGCGFSGKDTGSKVTFLGVKKFQTGLGWEGP